MKIKLMFFLLLVTALTGLLLADINLPDLSSRVTDNANILSWDTHQLLTQKLKAHEDRTTNQIAVLTVPSLGGVSVEEYAVRVFEKWKIGQADNDNGILILIAPNDRRMRIEVGYGLEGTLTDGMAGQIIQNIMTPKFKNGDFNGGITDGTMAVIDVLEGGELPAAAESSGKSETFLFDGPDIPLKERILLGAFIFGIIGLFTVIGVMTPGMGWFLYVFLIPFWAMFPIVVLGTKGAFILLVTYIIVFPIAKLIVSRTKWYKKAKKSIKKKGRASIGGFMVSSGGSRSSWSSGSSGFSGGFSGGGGSSGGGGASGSW